MRTQPAYPLAGGPGPTYCLHLVGIRRILFLQHASILGGSCVSLQYLLKGLDRSRFEPVVAVLHDSSEVLSYHSRAGCEVFHWPGMVTFEHTTAQWTSTGRPLSWLPALRTLSGWSRSRRLTMELVDRVQASLVHLNSAVLAPSASALRRGGVPFLWHVREAPPPGGRLRTHWLGSAIARWPSVPLFMTPLSRRLWTLRDAGEIVPESVDLELFHPARDGWAIRSSLGLSRKTPVVLFLGGLPEIKGIGTLVAALPSVRKVVTDVVCLMPGATSAAPSAPGRLARRGSTVLGTLTPGQRLERDLAALGESCRVTAFSSDVADLIAASDVLVFPAMRDHFSRPVMEAQAAGKAVIASRLPLMEEMVVHGETGVLVPPGDAAALATAILSLLADPAMRRRLGQAGRAVAERRHDAVRNTGAMMEIYDRLLAGSTLLPG